MNQTEYYETHPPRCIAPFVATLGKFEEGEFDGHGPGQINAVFRLACPCGSDRHAIYFYFWTNPEDPDQSVGLSPISLQCVSCKRKTDLFDTAIHGYDSEVGNGSVNRRAEGKYDLLECSPCNMSTAYQVLVRFEYPDDLLGGDFPEFEGRHQDLFTWFSLVGICPKCNAEYEVANIECA